MPRRREEIMMKKAVIVGLLLVVALTSLGLGREIVVTSTADSGKGSFRWALQTARSGDVITFDPVVFPPDDPATICLQSELPPIDRPRRAITIDASNVGVVIDGADVPGDWNNGLQIYTDDCVVMGLQLRNFTGSGITACGGSRNRIGGDPEVGTSPTGQGNLLASNGIGIDLCSGGADNVIAGNIIGTDVSLQEYLGNWPFGISIEDGVTDTTIGPANVLAHNHVAIDIQGQGALRNRLTRNVFHESQLTTVVLRGGGNLELPAPFVGLVDTAEGHVHGTACAGCDVEVLALSDDGWTSFEGLARANDDGEFLFEKGYALSGETVVALATDAEGNSSPPSARFGVASRIQQGTGELPERFATYPSDGLDDNRIAVFTCALLHPEYEPEVFPEYGVLDVSHILQLGVTRVRLSISNLDVDKIDWDVSEFEIKPEHDAFINELVGNDISVTFNLNFWDKDYAAEGGRVRHPRFRSDAEIDRYLDYVQFIVRHFRGRIDFYELWNEPTVRDCIMEVALRDYIELARRAIPIIRQEDPAAKVIVGSISFAIYPDAQEFLVGVLESDVMSVADAISWHPMYGTSPEYEYHRHYYYGYAELVRGWRRIADEHGFSGTFQGDELNWLTPDQSLPFDLQPWPNEYSEAQCAKYFARGIVMHLGLVDSTSVILLNNKPLVYGVIQNLCTAMAGNESIDTLATIDIDCDSPVATCAFRYANGDRLLAVWTDGIAQDEDPGVPATVTLPNMIAGSATGIDVLHGFEQELAFEIDGEDTIVRDLLVKDYPILIRLSDITFGPGYEETVGDGFHRIGDIDAVDATHGGADRDGDGVPDDEDYCPDWPGSKEANGC
jgi:hypothetical protein